jgi:hypothetical protein
MRRLQTGDCSRSLGDGDRWARVRESNDEEIGCGQLSVELSPFVEDPQPSSRPRHFANGLTPHGRSRSRPYRRDASDCVTDDPHRGRDAAPGAADLEPCAFELRPLERHLERAADLIDAIYKRARSCDSAGRERSIRPMRARQHRGACSRPSWSTTDRPARCLSPRRAMHRTGSSPARMRSVLPGKPSEAARALLKSRGFRWSPTAGACQRQATEAGRYANHR